MIEPFVRADNGYLVPEPSQQVEWFFNEPSIATRRYDGQLMRLTGNGWEFYVQPRTDGAPVTPGSQFCLDAPSTGWHPVFPRVSPVKQFLQVLQNTWSEIDSPFELREEFDSAELAFDDSFRNAEYWLVPNDSKWELIPVDSAEQLSNVNELDLHKIADPGEVFVTLQAALAPLRGNVYGVIFTSATGERTGVLLQDFDWSEHDAGRERN